MSIQKIKANLTLISFKEKKVYHIYSPAVDIYGYGYTEDEAKHSFQICFEQFIDYTTKKKTLVQELTRLGWVVKGGSKNRKFKQPNFSDLLIHNKDLYSLIDKKDYTKFSEKVEMPV
jgi:hypothetical protein